MKADGFTHDFTAIVRDHLDWFLENATDKYGGEQTNLWISSVDLNSGSFPAVKQDLGEPDFTKAGCFIRPGKRVYRYIDAPNGSSFYWDQPLISTLRKLSDITDDPKYATACRTYGQAFLMNGISNSGLFLWGNHYFHDVYRNCIVAFNGDDPPQPVDPLTCSGRLHEMRPVAPDWNFLLELDASATIQFIEALWNTHIFDPGAGGFNRHADKKSSCAFLEAGAILIDAFRFAWKKTGDSKWKDRIDKVAGYSWDHRNGETGLVENNPTVTRWDKYVSTTECGFWAGHLIRAYRDTGKDNLLRMAAETVESYLRYGFHTDSGKFYGKLRTTDGAPDLEKRQSPFEPGIYSNPWEHLFPAHDYFWDFADACLELYELTGEECFKEGISRCCRHGEQSLPVKAYAEQYGKGLAFCLKGSHYSDTQQFGHLKEQILESVFVNLYREPLFRSHPGDDQTDAVDGIGYLLSALLDLQSHAI